MLPDEVLILELLAVNAFATSAVSAGEIATLQTDEYKFEDAKRKRAQLKKYSGHNEHTWHMKSGITR